MQSKAIPSPIFTAIIPLVITALCHGVDKREFPSAALHELAERREYQGAPTPPPPVIMASHAVDDGQSDQGQPGIQVGQIHIDMNLNEFPFQEIRAPERWFMRGVWGLTRLCCLCRCGQELCLDFWADAFINALCNCDEES